MSREEEGGVVPSRQLGVVGPYDGAGCALRAVAGVVTRTTRLPPSNGTT